MIHRVSKLLIGILAGVLFITSCKNDTKKEESKTMMSSMPAASAPAAIENYGLVGTDSIKAVTLKNKHGMSVTLMNYGATILKLMVPDKNGTAGDVTLGFTSLDGYTGKTNPFFGCVAGRYANRIAKAQFTLNGKTYKLAANNGENSLHGGLKGFDKQVWGITQMTDSSVTMQYISKSGEEGFPGNLASQVRYSLTDQNALLLDYKASTDSTTVINLTNHTYFNLSAGSDTSILGHLMKINADQYTPVNDKLIPTGKIDSVGKTPFDFRVAKPIGKDIDKVKGGYDHNFIANRKQDDIIAEVYHPGSGRVMTVHTTQPGVQFYTGNFLNGAATGTKNNARYGQHSGFCLETQHYPDSPNQPGFPSVVLRPGDTYHEMTSYQFGVR